CSINQQDDSRQPSKQSSLDVNPDIVQHQSWFDGISSAWDNGKGLNETSKLLKKSFESSSNPHRTALYFMSESPDFICLNRETLGIAVMKTFQEWLRENDENREISTQLQSEAVDSVANHFDYKLIEMVADIYKLGDIGSQFVDNVKQMAKNGDHAQACFLATLLNIQKHFDINDFLVPLLLENKHKIVEKYLDKCPEQQELVVKFLDGLCIDSEEKMAELLVNLQFPRSKYPYWTSKKIKKVGRNLMKLYNISPDVCPNISEFDHAGALSYVVCMKYKARRIGKEAWEEMIDAHDVNLQVQLCSLVHRFNDLACATKFAVKYKVQDELPIPLKNFVKAKEGILKNNIKHYDHLESKFFIEPDDSYHSLSLPHSAIVYVDDEHKFKTMLDVLQNSEVISCDSEWHPLTDMNVSLIQIATEKQIFLIDLKNTTNRRSFWSVFENPNIKKIGFGLSLDLKAFSQCLPECKSIEIETKNLLDLQKLCEKLEEIRPDIFPHRPVDHHRKLSDIVVMCLGKKLDKREQCSNWENRPLRTKQIEYAALDAFCLLEIYNTLKIRAQELDIDLDVVMSLEKPRVIARDFKVVVDSSLKGLGEQLMQLGVDVKMSRVDEIIKIGLQEDRVILLSANLDKNVSSFLKRGMWLNIDESMSESEQTQIIYSDLNPGLNEHKLWLERLQMTWNKGRGHEKSSRLLKRSFMISNDPYRTALYFMTQSNLSTRNSTTNSLNAAVMKNFQEYLTETTSNSLENYHISPELQSDAFEAVKTQRVTDLISTVVDIYKLRDGGAKFVDGVKEMSKNGFYGSACLLASLLKIETHFSVNEFLVPLILQGKVSNVQLYLNDCPEQREIFLKSVDELFGENKQQLAERFQIEQTEILERTELKKVAKQFMKLYNISPNVCPRILQASSFGALKFLVDRKYNDGDMGSQAWEEMVESIVKNDMQLQVKLCLLLLSYEDLPCARKYAMKYKILTEHLPTTFKNALEGATDSLIFENSDEEIYNEVNGEYYSLPLPHSAISFVDNKCEFNTMLNVLQSSDIIGCDCEWKPREETKLSLFQIACRNQIFLIDPKVVDFEYDQGESDRIVAKDWMALLAVFTNPRIKKLGFNFFFDLKSLSQYLPEYNTFHTDTRNLLDLKDLCDKLFHNCPQIFPMWSYKSRRRLTDFVRMSLGKSLDKREQLSNWDNRPLRKQQIEYAASDVYCLLEVYDLLIDRAKQLDIDLDFIMSNGGVIKSESENNTVLTNGLKVVLDFRLYGLGNELRLLGVDVKMVTKARENALLVSLKEDRVIILSKNLLKNINQFIEPGMWYCVNMLLSEKEQALEILHFYNIKVTFRDIKS
uniref:3'-5' exonuclease domain-containing protein n=1 Tax=Strigamia maritima TaxID=126957 RepID=T1IT07_STRMM